MPPRMAAQSLKRPKSPGSSRGEDSKVHPEPGDIFLPVVPALHAAVTVRAFRWDSFPEVKADLLCEATLLDVTAACLYFDDHAALGCPAVFTPKVPSGSFAQRPRVSIENP